jgi:hypothetical protein
MFASLLLLAHAVGPKRFSLKSGSEAVLAPRDIAVDEYAIMACLEQKGASLVNKADWAKTLGVCCGELPKGEGCAD